MTVGFLQWHLHFSETIYLGGIFNLPVKLHLEKKSHLNSAISLFFFIPSHYSESLLSCQIREKKKERKIVRSLSISFDLIAQTLSFAKLGFQTLLIILVFSYFTIRSTNNQPLFNQNSKDEPYLSKAVFTSVLFSKQKNHFQMF